MTLRQVSLLCMKTTPEVVQNMCGSSLLSAGVWTYFFYLLKIFLNLLLDAEPRDGEVGRFL